jgi:hypothetical protein
VKAARFEDSAGKSMQTADGQFDAEFLSLYGLEILNKSGQTTFQIDSNGNVSLRGSIRMGAGSVIEWNNLGGDPYALADEANGAAATAKNNLAKLVAGTYSGGTFISGTEIKSPKITAGQFYGAEYWNALETAYMKVGGSGSWADFGLFRAADSTPIFRVYDETGYGGGLISLQKSGATFLSTSGASTRPYGDWDFSFANVSNVPAVFG